MPSYLITGAKGQLGQCFQAISKEFPKNILIFANQNEVDLTRPETLKKSYNKQPFEGIINCAAYTNVDNAEEEFEMAYRINAEGLKNLSIFAEKKGLSVVNFSTDHIFDGTQSVPYNENDTPNPINSYGQSKFEGEKMLKRFKGKHTTFRLSWLFSPYGNNFVRTILKLSKAKKKIKVVNDQWGCPTYGIELARMVLTYLEKPQLFDHNCYHFTQQIPVTWFDFAHKIISFNKISCKVIPCSTSEYPTKAKRPQYSVLDTTRIENHLLLKPITWDIALEDCLNRIKVL